MGMGGGGGRGTGGLPCQTRRWGGVGWVGGDCHSRDLGSSRPFKRTAEVQTTLLLHSYTQQLVSSKLTETEGRGPSHS